jgi:deoxyribose-phosphate aldolase
VHKFLAKIENTLYKPEALSPEIHKIVADAMQFQMAAVCVAPVWVPSVAKMLRGSGVRLSSAVGFPNGTNKSTLKAIEATSTIKDGADEIEVVAHLAPLVSFDVDASRSELMEIVRAARSTRRDVFIKVVVETGLLMKLPGERAERAIETACRAVRESGCDAIVTSTGFHPAGGATPEAIRLLQKYGQALQIKAVGVSLEEMETVAEMVDRMGIENAGAILSRPVA